MATAKSSAALLSCLAVFCVFSGHDCAHIENDIFVHSDEVTALPTWSQKLPSRQYSGYLDVKHPNEVVKRLHYWFVESENDPKSDPVVLWLNGGPGCSSLDGYLAELGPFWVTCAHPSSKHINNTRPQVEQCFLERNEFTWAKKANVLFLEAPVGVGFSYSPANPPGHAYQCSDVTTAEDNYQALLAFFREYQEFRSNKFFVTGESYAGIYIPTLVHRIDNGNKHALPVELIALEGFAVGNGLTSWKANQASSLFFGYYHGLFSPTTWDTLTKQCCSGVPHRYNCDFEKTRQCRHLVAELSYTIYESGLNYYGIYSECEKDESVSRMVKMTFRGLEKLIRARQSDTFLEIPCIDTHPPTQYLKSAAVREALHISPESPHWEICASDRRLQYTNTYTTVMPIYEQLVEKYRILIFNGDTDLACNFLGAQWDFADMHLENENGYREWHVAGQIAGYVQGYAPNVTVMTVRGAGHMVPQDKPRVALEMFEKFINNEQFE